MAFKFKEEKQTIKQNIKIQFGKILHGCLKPFKIGAEPNNTACTMLGIEQELVNREESF